MSRLLAVLTLLCSSPVAAQDHYAPPEPDKLELRASELAFAEVFYSNSAAQSSGEVDEILTLETLRVRVVIKVDSGPERIRVTPEGLYIAIPESAFIEDGESIVIEIHPAMF